MFDFRGGVVSFAIMMLCVGSEIAAALIAAVPALCTGMKIASILYIL